MKLLSINRIKKIAIVSFAVMVVLFTNIKPVKADQTDAPILQAILGVVQTISGISTGILTAVSSFGTYLVNLTTADPTSAGAASLITTLVGDFAGTSATPSTTATPGLSALLQQDTNINYSLQAQLTTTLFGSTPAANQNQLMYTNLLDPASPSTPLYIANASGATIPHTSPDLLNFTSPTTQAKYTSYYNTVMAISSFNAYVLGSMGVNETSLNAAQQKLITDVGSAGWFAEVASAPIAYVLRRILIFQSQQFLLFNDLLKVQKQMLYAQVMTNSLLINSARTDEAILIKNSVS